MKATILALLASFSMAGAEFQIPQPNPNFEFPRDHGSHPEFRIEWWYLTGHLFSGERRFGVQATFFRLADKPGGAQFYLAHMAISDPESSRFLHEQRLNREGWDAGASTADLEMRNGNWSLRRIAESALQLIGSVRSEAIWTLRLEPLKDPVIFGENGVSRKGSEPSAASYYITFPRLRAAGTLRIGGESHDVTGELWMDHEISSSQLGRDQVGWDWVSIQLEDGRELMAYILRTKSGAPSRFSTAAWIGKDGAVTHLREFAWEPGGLWTSPATGARYPISPRLRVSDPDSGGEREFSIRPVMNDQEITGGISYWEGAADVLDEGGGKVGRAFLELTGYAPGEDLNRRLRGE